MSKRVYISGQMTGLLREEYLARFARAEELLMQEGYEVANPTKFFICRHLWAYRIIGYVCAQLYDLWRLNKCDMIYKIPGWKQSRGANIESCWAFHMGVYLLPPKTRASIDLKMAKFIEKQWERSDTYPVDLADLQRRAQERNNLVIVKPDRPAPTPPKKPNTSTTAKIKDQ